MHDRHVLLIWGVFVMNATVQGAPQGARVRGVGGSATWTAVPAYNPGHPLSPRPVHIAVPKGNVALWFMHCGVTNDSSGP